MNELELLEDLLRRIGTDHGHLDHVDEQLHGGIDAELWRTLEGAGVTLLSVSETAGGSGGSLAQAALVVRLVAEHALPVPVAESSFLAGWLLATVGLEVPTGPLTAAMADLRVGTENVEGSAARVPFGSAAEHVVMLSTEDIGGSLLLAPAAVLECAPGTNVAEEPRDDLRISAALGAEHVQHVSDDVVDEFRIRSACVRSIALAGAAKRALDLTVRYTAEREQFGRPIARFQAVQQQLAELAGEVAAMGAAVDACVATCAREGMLTPASRTAVAAAKARTSQGAGVVARIAHQLHGALGFTREHELRLATTRLWAWRDEHGNEAVWNHVLGRQALRSHDPWALITQA